MNELTSLHSVESMLASMLPDIAATGWSTSAVDDARDILLAVVSKDKLQSAKPSVRSKAEILREWRYLLYWYFEGAPLSVQLALWVGLKVGLLTPPVDGQKRIDEFLTFFPRQIAFEAAKRKSETVGGWIFPAEAELFWEIIDATATTPGDVAEIGSWTGRSSILLAAGLKAISPSKRLHLVDDWCFGGQPSLYPYLSDARDIRSELEENVAPWRERIVVHEGLFQNAVPMMTQASPEGFSLIFHDAGHTAVDFLRDLPLIYPLLNHGGYLLIHDYVSINFCEAKETIDVWVASNADLVMERSVGTCAVIARRS